MRASKIPKLNKAWFDGTHLIRRVGDSSRLEAAPADGDGKQLGPFEPVKGRAVWGECIAFVRRKEYSAQASKVLAILAE